MSKILLWFPLVFLFSRFKWHRNLVGGLWARATDSPQAGRWFLCDSIQNATSAIFHYAIKKRVDTEIEFYNANKSAEAFSFQIETYREDF